MNPESATLLTMEQQFELRKYQDLITRISREDLEELCIEVMRQKMAQANVFHSLMREGVTGIDQCGGR